MHTDHIMGLPGQPKDIPIYVGNSETSFKRFVNLFSQNLTDKLVSGFGPMQELGFEPDSSGVFSGVLALFGDQSVFMIYSPGHTPGSVAFLLRTTNGPVLVNGDTCHTKWRWENVVEPGSFTYDHAMNSKNFAALKALSQRHPPMLV